MSKLTVSANGGALPAEGLTTRRTALTALIGASALAVGLSKPSAADAAELDAPLFDLLDRWRSAYARSEAADERLWRAEDLVRVVKPPAALIKTQEDHRLFNSDERVGSAYETAKSVATMEFIISVLAGSRLGGANLPRMVKRAEEVLASHREYEAAIEAAKRSLGFEEIKAEQKAATEADWALRREVLEARPRTVPGLLAKLTAVAEAFGHDNLEEEMAPEVSEDITLGRLALSVLRDGAAVLNRTVPA